MQGYIKRNVESNIQNALKEFPVLMVTGARQVGKSTLLRSLETEVEYEYITLDNPLDRASAISEPQAFLRRHKPPIIIDEIQYAPELLPYIKILVDEKRFEDKQNSNGMFILTGSQMFKLMKGVSESLAGRVCIFHLYGLSHNEILGEKDLPFLPTHERIGEGANKKHFSIDELYEVIHRGMFPELTHGVNIQNFYSGYLQTYLERDIRDIVAIKDEMKFLKFMASIAVRTAQEIRYDDITKEVEIDIKTAQSWLSILQTSGLVYMLQPYSNNAIKRIIKTPKIYFMDTGLACFLARYVDSRTLEVSAYSGAIFETYVMTEIIKTYSNSGMYPELYLYFYRDSNKKEIDLLIVQNGIVYPVEIKKSGNPSTAIVNNFSVLSPLEKANLKISEGGVICMVDKIVPINNRNNFIPVQCI
ncbi:MAG: ATP-binding protein [Oscillospiraceae bacterium]|nr:ATP-binding protein [Oscillospiraceae bacterium]